MVFPGVLDARSSLHHPQDNLGSARRVGKHSTESLQMASLRAQKQAVSFPVLDRIAPALKGTRLTRSLSEPILPQHLALEERNQTQVSTTSPSPHPVLACGLSA